MKGLRVPWAKGKPCNSKVLVGGNYPARLRRLFAFLRTLRTLSLKGVYFVGVSLNWHKLHRLRVWAVDSS